MLDSQLKAHFHARFWKIFSFNYSVPLQVYNSGGGFTFEGAADLGKLAGGTYHYSGGVVGTNWQSTYRSQGDHGDFSMNRVP